MASCHYLTVSEQAKYRDPESKLNFHKIILFIISVLVLYAHHTERHSCLSNTESALY